MSDASIGEWVNCGQRRAYRSFGDGASHHGVVMKSKQMQPHDALVLKCHK